MSYTPNEMSQIFIEWNKFIEVSKPSICSILKESLDDFNKSLAFNPISKDEALKQSMLPLSQVEMVSGTKLSPQVVKQYNVLMETIINLSSKNNMIDTNSVKNVTNQLFKSICAV